MSAKRRWRGTLFPTLPNEGYLIADSEYDSNPLYDLEITRDTNSLRHSDNEERDWTSSPVLTGFAVSS